MKFQAVPANFSDSIPTFSQWCRTVADKTAVIPHVVEVIWTPNLYNNYTLQTSSYRFRVPEGHPYFEIIQNYISVWCEEGAVLVLRSSFEPKAALELEVLEDSVSHWEELGESGYKIVEIKAPSKTSSQKTSKQNTAKNQPAACKALQQGSN